MTEVAEVSLEQRVAGLESKLDSISIRHLEFETVHVSRRGVSGPVGPTGPTGSTGAPADPKEVATLASEIVKKSFRYDTERAKFETLLSELKGEIGVVLASLRFAVIEELKLGGVLDAEGRAVLGPQGPAGKDSITPGPTGSQGSTGPAGNDGVDGRDGRDGQDGKSIVGPQGPAGADSTVPGPKGTQGEVGPEGLRGYPGEGLSKQDVIDLVFDLKRRKSI